MAVLKDGNWTSLELVSGTDCLVPMDPEASVGRCLFLELAVGVAFDRTEAAASFIIGRVGNRAWVHIAAWATLGSNVVAGARWGFIGQVAAI